MAIKSAISFGLVHIPISLHNATRDNDISFNQLHKDDHERIRYKKTCGHCGEEVSPSDIVKGFEYDKDKYVVITEADMEKIKTEKDRTIHIMHFATLDQISPVYYEKTYHAIPEMGGDKAFELLRTAMIDEQKIAIAKTVIGSKETLLTLIPREDGLLVQTMFYNDEIKELPNSYIKHDVDATQLKMAKSLISSMEQPFDPSAYKDEYQERLRTMIADKISGNEVVSPSTENRSNVIDLMEALRESVERSKKAGPKAKSNSKPKAKTG